MTKERFRSLMKRMMPRTLGDTIPRGLHAVLKQHEIQKRRRYGKCSCGVTIAAGSEHCRMHMHGRPIAQITLCQNSA